MGNGEEDQACETGFGYGVSVFLAFPCIRVLIACFPRLLRNPRESLCGLLFLTPRETFRYLSCSERPRIPPKVGERVVRCVWTGDGMTDVYAMEREEEVHEAMTGWRSFRVVRWGRTKVVNPLIVILQRGTEPKQLASSAALGFTLGVFPIYGVTALLCGVAIAVLGSRINGPTLILANLIATPFEFSLMIPFLRVGEALVGASAFPLTKDALWQAITGKASGELLHAIGHALLGWLVVGPFLCVALYLGLVPLIKWSQQQLGGQDRVPSERVVLLNEEVLLGKKDLGE